MVHTRKKILYFGVEKGSVDEINGYAVGSIQAFMPLAHCLLVAPEMFHYKINFVSSHVVLINSSTQNQAWV